MVLEVLKVPWGAKGAGADRATVLVKHLSTSTTDTYSTPSTYSTGALRRAYLVATY
jgi:hypothetical protein